MTYFSDIWVKHFFLTMAQIVLEGPENVASISLIMSSIWYQGYMRLARGGTMLIMVYICLSTLLVCISGKGISWAAPSSSWFDKGVFTVVLKYFHKRS